MAKWIATRYHCIGRGATRKILMSHPPVVFDKVEGICLYVNVVVNLIRFALNQHDNQTQSRTEALPCGLHIVKNVCDESMCSVNPG